MNKQIAGGISVLPVLLSPDKAKRVTEPEDMPKACDEGIKQITERKYAKSIPNGYRTILC